MASLKSDRKKNIIIHMDTLACKVSTFFSEGMSSIFSVMEPGVEAPGAIVHAVSLCISMFTRCLLCFELHCSSVLVVVVGQYSHASGFTILK